MKLRGIISGKIYTAILFLLITMTAGTVGFMIIEGYNFLEALYMTIITISTVGFQEVRPLSDNGRIFTIVLIIVAFGFIAYSISTVSSFILDGEFRIRLRKYKMQKRIDDLKNHVIVCGFGRNGQKACEILEKEKIPYVVVEKSHGIRKKLIDLQIPFFEADAVQDEILHAAGIERARALLATLPDDAENLFIVLTAREINPNLAIISRASHDSSVNKLKRAGANNVIMPDRIGGAHMASLVINPDIKEFIDLLSLDSGTPNFLKEIKATESCKLINQTVGSIKSDPDIDLVILGIKQNNEYDINPERDTVIKDGSGLILLGTDKQIKEFKKKYHLK